MTDMYGMINHACCNYPRLQLVYEPSLGYPPFVVCLRCNHQTEAKPPLVIE
jgi:hypothetical protein